MDFFFFEKEAFLEPNFDLATTDTESMRVKDTEVFTSPIANVITMNLLLNQPCLMLSRHYFLMGQQNLSHHFLLKHEHLAKSLFGGEVHILRIGIMSISHSLADRRAFHRRSDIQYPASNVGFVTHKLH